jgi:hypothetical protein
MKFPLLILTILFISCKSEPYNINNYYTESERDSLLTNIITYVYIKAPGATDSTKWEPKYRTFYKNSLPSFHIDKYAIKNDWHYYFLIRPVGGSDKRRGVIGKFKLKEKSLMPFEFEEVVCTPHLDEEIVKHRGGFLFQEYLKSDNLEKYLPMKHYIEWPDSTLIYNKITNSWEVPVK